MIVLLAVMVALALLLRTRRPDGDLPERIVAAAATRLPADRRPWGQALVAELAAIPGRGQRWRFAAGVVRIAAFPPARTSATAWATVAVGALLTLTGTVIAIRLVPTAAFFVAVLGVLTSGCATALARRRQRWSGSRAQLAAAGLTVAGVLAAISAVIAVAANHPSATRDQTHVFSVVFAVVLCGYLVAGLSATPTGSGGAIVWVAAAASLAVGASTLLLPAEAVTAPISPIIAAATLAATLGIGAATGDRTAATRAGLLTAVLATPTHFAAAILVAQASPAVLTDPYDMAAYPGSGYPDVASYLISDTVAGNIVSLAVTPLAMFALAVVAAAGSPRLHRR